ncbi:MAG: PHP domain-containing protein [Candidatus Heimdallarchaeota archaeon]|nr:PHP domain-containing protein [Candidatus Heimdallarchaeota archaeon]
MKPEESIDLHIHTTFSDGYSSPESVIQTAIAKNLKQICITDHFSTSKPALNTIDELENYYQILQKLKRKFSAQIRVSIGIEVDLLSISSLDILKTISWDLILFEYVFTSPYWEENFRKVIKFKQSSKSQVGLAHTRFSRVTQSKFEQVMNSIRENEVIIELNTRYRNYHDPWFNYLDEENWYSIGSDAHSCERVGDVKEALSFLYKRNIPVTRIIQI